MRPQNSNAHALFKNVHSFLPTFTLSLAALTVIMRNLITRHTITDKKFTLKEPLPGA